MKNISIAILMFLLATAGLSAQISKGGTPPSFNNPVKRIDQVLEVIPPSQETIDSLSKDGKNAQPNIYGVFLDVGADIESDGTWDYLSDGSRVLRLAIRSEGASAMSCTFEDFYMPVGSQLFLYDKSRSKVIGAFGAHNNRTSGILATELIKGDEFVIEYVESPETIEIPSLKISKLLYAFRDVEFLDDSKNEEPQNFGQSQSCEVNINCSPEGDDWQDEKRGVARISVVTAGSAGWCTGSLIGNADGDDTPYFLTADHCSYYNSQYSSTSDLAEWVFYFNYESSTCSNPGTEPTSNTISGCTLVSHGGCAGDCGSDFYLVELSSVPPEVYDVYYNGWNRSTSPSGSGVSIHHPAGDIKKISTYQTSLVSSQWEDPYPNTHWQVTWAETDNGHGVTEGGSSGSPIFDAQGRIVGSLTGGSSYCSTPTRPDLYGKFSYHWESNGSTPQTRLSNWLDPSGSGATSIDGYSPYAGGGGYSVDAELYQIVEPGEDFCGDSFTPTFRIRNQGSDNITSATVYYSIDSETPLSESWTGNLSTGQTADVVFAQRTISEGSHTLNAWVNNPNGTDDENLSNDSESLSIESGKNIRVSITTDDFGSETSWNIKDENETVVASGDNYGNSTTYQTEHCLGLGCYTFTIFDEYGDGICCEYGDGSYTLENLSTSETVASGGEFGSSATHEFCISETCPTALAVQNEIVAAEQSRDFFAMEELIIAGSGASFLSQSGSQVYAGAGTSVKLLPGALISAGSSFLAEINAGDCQKPAPPTIPSDDFISSFEPSFYGNLSNDCDLLIYPNPSDGKFFVKILEGSPDFRELEIFNAVGEKVYETNVTKSLTEVDFTAFPTGLYVVRVLKNNSNFKIGRVTLSH